MTPPRVQGTTALQFRWCRPTRVVSRIVPPEAIRPTKCCSKLSSSSPPIPASAFVIGEFLSPLWRSSLMSNGHLTTPLSLAKEVFQSFFFRKNCRRAPDRPLDVSSNRRPLGSPRPSQPQNFGRRLLGKLSQTSVPSSSLVRFLSFLFFGMRPLFFPRVSPFFFPQVV